MKASGRSGALPNRYILANPSRFHLPAGRRIADNRMPLA
jgi:hypothetical protein